MMVNNLVQRLSADIEKLTLGHELAILSVAIPLIFAAIIFFIVVWSYVDPYKKARKELPTQNRLNPLVTLFVAVRNDELAIVDCVESMLNQTYVNREIFVVDDASDDETSNVLKQRFGDNPEINIIYLKKNVGKKRALAKAIKVSKGEIFAFTDSDSIWKEDAIERIVAIFENEPEVGAISGHCNAKNANSNLLTRMQDTWYEKQYRLRKGFESVFRSVSCVSGPLACYRRSAIYNYIPRWTNDKFLGKEFRFATDRVMTGFVLCGSELGPKIKNEYSHSSFVKDEDYPNKDWDVVYCNSAKSWTIVPETMDKIISQKIRWNKSFIRNLFFTGKFYWKKPLPTALYYYLQIIFVFVYPLLITTLVALLLLNDYSLLLAVCFMGYAVLSAIMTSVLASENKKMYEPITGILLYHLLFQWLIFYSIATIRNMNWKRESVREI